ncbi:hypothetical protein T439DRAFT_356515 [Meredithblackwellia eburnea MCA 4105]
MADTFSFHPPPHQLHSADNNFNNNPSPINTSFNHQAGPSSSRPTSSAGMQPSPDDPSSPYEVFSHHPPPFNNNNHSTHGNQEIDQLDDDNNDDDNETVPPRSSQAPASLSPVGVGATAPRGDSTATTMASGHYPLSMSSHFTNNSSWHNPAGINTTNTRPMTAPSSSSAPYFQSAHYAPQAFGASSPFVPLGGYPSHHHHQQQSHHSPHDQYHPGQHHPHHPHHQQQSSISSSNGAPRPGSSHSTSFQYQVDSRVPNDDDDSVYRARNFSLPELPGSGIGGGGGGGGSGGSGDSDGGLPDEPRYPGAGGAPGDNRFSFSSSSANSPSGGGPFLFGSPPPTSLRGPLGQQQQQHHLANGLPGYYPSGGAHLPFHSSGGGGGGHDSSPEQSDLYSRPTTADSRTTSSSRTTVGPASQDLPSLTGAGGGGAKVYNFIAQPGQTTKRPRRRYDEIERLYNCDYPGCTKAYGTLNHLNSHKTMQKHGPKSTPAQFKELRKAWRENKKAAAAAAARNAAAKGGKEIGLNGGPGSRMGGGASGAPNRSRVRPSTSAGEYHYNVAAPFMSSLGAPVNNFPLPAPITAGSSAFPPPLHALPPPSSGWAAGGYNPAVGGPPPLPVGAIATYETFPPSSPMRPVTAPSYYQAAPVFGYSAPPPSSSTGHHDYGHGGHHPSFALPERRLSGDGGGGLVGLGAGPRRMSATFAFNAETGSGFPSILEESVYPAVTTAGYDGAAAHHEELEARRLAVESR